jgi:hypothetical protein
MVRKHLVGLGLLLAFVGAIGAFTLDGDRTIFDAIQVEPLGFVLLAFGAVFLVWGAAQWWFYFGPKATAKTGAADRAKAVQSIGGLIAVVFGVGAVAAVTIIIVTSIAGLEETGVVSISTSAFGVISTVTGAFIGIKIGTDQTQDAVKNAADAGAVAAAATATLNPDQIDAFHQTLAGTKQALSPDEPEDPPDGPKDPEEPPEDPPTPAPQR